MTEKTIKVEMTLDQLQRVSFSLFDRYVDWGKEAKKAEKKGKTEKAATCSNIEEDYYEDFQRFHNLWVKLDEESKVEDKKEESDARAEWCEKCNHPLWDGVCPDCGAGVKEEMDWEFFSDRDVQEQEVKDGAN